VSQRGANFRRAFVVSLLVTSIFYYGLYYSIQFTIQKIEKLLGPPAPVACLSSCGSNSISVWNLSEKYPETMNVQEWIIEYICQL
jgi:hypothetical protein